MDDYISRQDAIRAARHGWYKGLEPSQYIEIIDAADVAPVRHGQWLNSHHTRIVTCSLCGGTVPTNWRGHYCQNCGAKMDGGTHDESDA